MPTKIAKSHSWRWAEAPYTEIDDDRHGEEDQKRKLWGRKVRNLFRWHRDPNLFFSIANPFANLLVCAIGTAIGLMKFERRNIQVKQWFNDCPDSVREPFPLYWYAYFSSHVITEKKTIWKRSQRQKTLIIWMIKTHRKVLSLSHQSWLVERSPDYLSPSCCRKEKKEYLILWRGLSYAEVSWIEEDGDEIPGLEDAIKAYWEHRKKVMDQKSKRDKK